MYNHKKDISKGLQHIKEATNCFGSAKGGSNLKRSDRKKINKALNHLSGANKKLK